MRDINVIVDSLRIRDQDTWPYPKGRQADRYMIPVYKLHVQGTGDSGSSVSETFDVLRFGVYCPDGKTTSVVGLADAQRHRIKAWIPSYKVHSASSKENGAWQVFKDFLIHDGPDNSDEIFATIGCIEIMGAAGFTKFNDLIISLSGAKGATRQAKLAAIGNSGQMYIEYKKAVRPPLIKVTMAEI